VNSVQVRKLFKYSNIGTSKVLILLDQGKASILNLQIWAELEIWNKIWNRAGPTSQRPKLFSNNAHRLPDPHHSPPTRPPHSDRAHGGECTGAEHRPSLPLPMPGQTLSGTVEGSLPFSFLPLHYFCSASLLATTLLHIVGHLRPLFLPTQLGNCTATTPSACRSNHEPESLASNAGKSHSLSCHLPLTASPSITVIRAPPASPPHLGGPCESVVRPHLHLCHWRPPVHVTIELSPTTEFLAVTPLLRWVPHHQTTLNRSPLVQASSLATPCPTSSPVMVGIGRWAIGGLRGNEAPIFNLGRPVSAQRNSAIFLFPIDLFNSNSIMNLNFRNS
jgi:hypothetical protein